MLIVALLGLGFPAIALAQSPRQEQQDRNRPETSSPQQNTLRLRLLYYYDEENQAPHLRHPLTPFGIPQFGLRDSSNLLEFDADYIFLGRPEASAEAAPFITPSLSLTSQTIEVGRSFGDVQRIVTGNPFNPPSPTKPGLFGNGASDETDTGSAVLIGPEIDLLIQQDMSQWGVTSWLPAWTSLHLYARALVGEFEVFDVGECDLRLLSFGPRVNIPLLQAEGLQTGLTISAGPAFLWTDIGDAVGAEAAAGLRFNLPITSELAFTTTVGYGYFSAENVASHGPLLNFGLTLSW